MMISRFPMYLIKYVVLTGCLTLTGCAGFSSSPIPEDHFYRLPEVTPATVLNTALIKGTLGVASLTSNGLYRERSLLYINQLQPLELHQYHYYYWTDTPTRLIQENFLSFLRISGLGNKIIRFEPGADADAWISGKLLRFERILDQNNAKVMVAIELQFFVKDKQQAQFNKEYVVTMPTQNLSMYSTVEAFGGALRRIYHEFIEDLLT